MAAGESYADAPIATLLGHAQCGVTARHYIRRPDEALIAAVDRTAARIARALAGEARNAAILPIRGDLIAPRTGDTPAMH